MTQTPEAFSRLVAPVSAEDFFRNYWEKKELFISRAAPDYFEDTLRVSDVDDYFQNQHISPGFLNVTQKGEHSPPENWTYTAAKSGGFSQRIVDLKKLLELFGSGATIIINSGETAFPSLVELRCALESELKCFVQANIYITPPNSQGFAAHLDTHNVFILQIYGKKHWNLYDTPIESPVGLSSSLEEMHYEEREPNRKIEMTSGDMLYVPRGMVHSARAAETSSIHVTIGPLVRHQTHLLKLLTEKADEMVFFRQLLPTELESGNDSFESEFKRQLHDFLENTDLAEFHRTGFARKRRINTRRRFTDALQIERLSPDSTVCRRPFLDYVIERNDQWLTIRFEEDEISLPVFLEHALPKMFTPEPFAVREIEGVPNDAGKIALVRRFLQAGFLTIVSI